MTLSIENQKRKALANFLKGTLTEATRLIDNSYYLVLTEDERYDRAYDEIKTNISYYSYGWLSKYCQPLSSLGIELWEILLESGKENELNHFLLNNIYLSDFVSDYLETNGVGNELAFYDGEEHCTEWDCDCELDYDFFIYRTN